MTEKEVKMHLRIERNNLIRTPPTKRKPEYVVIIVSRYVAIHNEENLSIAEINEKCTKLKKKSCIWK